MVKYSLERAFCKRCRLHDYVPHLLYSYLSKQHKNDRPLPFSLAVQSPIASAIIPAGAHNFRLLLTVSQNFPVAWLIMVSTMTKRVMSPAPKGYHFFPFSPLHSNAKKHPTSKPSACPTFESEDPKVSNSGLIMPRVGARVELIRELRSNNFLDVIDESYAEISHGLNLALLMQFASRRSIHMNNNFHDGMTSALRLLTRNNMQTREGRRNSGRRISLLKLGSNPAVSKSRRYLQTFSRFLRLDCEIEKQTLDERVFFVQAMLMERYVERRAPLVKSLAWLNRVLPNSSDRVFEFHTRMTRRSFGRLLHLLQTQRSTFFLNKRGWKQLPIDIQLHLGLFCLGFYGNAAAFEAASAKFGYAVGTIYNARNRVISALVSLTSDFIRRPNSDERDELCRQVRMRHGYHRAFFLVDGTTHNFAFVPKYDRTAWFDRKSNYSMQALVTCDANLRVIHLVVGWPGSTHDARVLKSADYMNKDNSLDYFTGDQHGLGDAAFGLHMRVVPNYKEPLASIPENREYNLRYSSLRVRSEHVIGLVKNRFQGLREIRVKLNSKKDVRPIVDFITAGYVLHNILQKFKDDWEAPNEGDEDDASDIDQTESSSEELEDIESPEAAQLFREKVKRQVLRFFGYQ